MSFPAPSSIDQVIRARRTTKVLSSQELPVVDTGEVLEQLLEVAGWAPFHRACDPVHREHKSLSGIEPWRFYRLDATACRQLRRQLPADISGKIPAMLAAADAMVMVTWLPNPAMQPEADADANANADARQSVASTANPSSQFVADYPPRFEPTMGNMEHIAAASAAVQNLLIAATARGIANYWSSGGVLRCPASFDLLGIPLAEILLGAIFLFPGEVGEADVVGSKLREHRTSPQHWSRPVVARA